MLKTGLVSITFRKLTVEAVVQLVRDAGLDGIEWGGDVHVPHGDVAQARRVRALCADAGVEVAAYGSYYRLGDKPEVAFEDVLATASALGAPTIRVWAGEQGSAVADSEYRQAVADDARRIAEMARRQKIGIALEFHANTLTDTTASALELLAAVGHENVGSYWQPPAGWQEAQNQESLRSILPYLANLHVFMWADDGARLPLAAGRERWQPLFQIVHDEKPAFDGYAMVEFVAGDEPEALLADAGALRGMIGGISGYPARIRT